MYSASLAVSQICLCISACNDSFFLRSVFVPARCRLGTAFSLALARFPSCAVCVCVFFLQSYLCDFFLPFRHSVLATFGSTRQGQARPVILNISHATVHTQSGASERHVTTSRHVQLEPCLLERFVPSWQVEKVYQTSGQLIEGRM